MHYFRGLWQCLVLSLQNLCPETVSPNPKPGISTEVKSSIDDAPYVIPQLLASQCSNCRQVPLLFYI